MTDPNPTAVPDPTALPTPTRSMKPLSARIIATVAAVVLLLTVGTIAGLLWWVNASGLSGTELTTARLDAIKIGLSIAIGGGGVFALYLAWRRQRSNEADHQQRERALRHQQDVAADTMRDALERRITELYTRAADQLGSDKAAVRLAGLYALERLGQDNERHRQTIVDVLCAYLRMPYDPTETPTAGSPAWEVPAELRARVEERQVRLTAQHILAKHLYRGAATEPKPTFWDDIDLDLTGAVLIDFQLALCRVGSAQFGEATFTGPTVIAATEFYGDVSFQRAQFDGNARFSQTEFDSDEISFMHARFTQAAIFEAATFHGWTRFMGAKFAGSAIFDRAQFHAVTFHLVEFAAETSFHEVTFTKSLSFGGAKFAQSVPEDIQHLVKDIQHAVDEAEESADDGS